MRPDDVAGYARLLDDLVDLGTADLVSLLDALRGSSPDRVRDVLLDVLLPTLDPYSESAALLAVEQYAVARADARAPGRYVPQPAAPIQPSRTDALTRWAVGPLYVPDAGSAEWGQMVSSLLGGAQRLLMNQARDTTTGNALADTRNLEQWGRVARPGCCAFCSVMASRAAHGSFQSFYSSEAAALRVVGRGKAIPPPDVHLGRGGRAKGVHARGGRQLGEKYHDYCRCIAIQRSPANSAYIQEQAEQHKEVYDQVKGGDLRDVLALMRADNPGMR